MKNISKPKKGIAPAEGRARYWPCQLDAIRSKKPWKVPFEPPRIYDCLQRMKTQVDFFGGFLFFPAYTFTCMKKVHSPAINASYWISEKAAPSPDGLPVYTAAEVALIKKFRETLNDEMLRKIYELKKTMQCDLTQIDLTKAVVPSKTGSAPVTVDARPEETPAQDIGLHPTRVPMNSREAAQTIGKSITQMLEAKKAAQKAPKAAQATPPPPQPELFK